ncbi:MAG: ABC transporter ATP-binding protein [Planctomycetota bacterium]
MTPLLSVRDLVVEFDTERGAVRAVDGVSFDIHEGKTLALVGESGCGKSVTAMSLLRLVAPPGRIAGGQVLLDGRDLASFTEAEMCSIRGDRVSMIFQEPQTSLNPVMTAGRQVLEAVELHTALRGRASRDRVIELFGKVRIPSPETRVDDYPHQMSGGMKQRVMIAMALACNPSLLVADEPTTALDVTIQAQILGLLRELMSGSRSAVLLITHDFGVVAEVADDVAVMYAGRIVEKAAVREVFERPLHPYTQALLRSRPRLGERQGRLEAIPGFVPGLHEMPAGCRFHPRCLEAVDRCRTGDVALRELAPGHWVACHLR